MPQVALVTGASRGIGAAIARDLGRRGYHVVVNYRSSADAARCVVDDIEAAGGSAQSIAADVCDPDQVAAMVDAVLSAHGTVDALVCNANTVNPVFEPLESLTWNTFIDKVSGELAGAFFITQRVLPIMRSNRRGRIVYVSSTVADTAGPGRVGHGTAKSALNTFSRNVAAEVGRYGVVVNTVAPGAVRTESSAAVLADRYEEHIKRNSVLDRVLEPEDVAKVIGLVLDEGFGGVTGSLIRVDGGLSVLGGGLPLDSR